MEELISYIGSTDPELRDTIGLEAFIPGSDRDVIARTICIALSLV